ncbi:MAG: hypothetical protein RRZ64_08605 [Rikenellaceae bacterium]
MKKVNLLLMMLTSFAMVFTSCQDPVKGEQKEEEGIKEITIGITGNESGIITVLGSDVKKDILVSSAEDVDRDIEVSLSLDINDGSAVLSDPKVIILKGTKSAKATITFPASSYPSGSEEKSVTVTASTKAEKVVLSPSYTTFNVKGDVADDGLKAEVSISTDGTSVSVAGSDVTKTIAVNLSKISKEKITVKLISQSNAPVNGALSTSFVTFEAGETSKTATIKFAAKDFGNDVEAKITVTATSDDADVIASASSIIFTVKGPITKTKVEVRWYPDLTDVYFVNGATEAQRVAVYFETKDRVKASADISLVPYITGVAAADYVLETPTAVITKGSNYAWFYFNINSSAVNKNLNLSFTSADATFVSEQNDYVIKVKPLSPPQKKYDCQVGLSINGQKEATFTVEKDICDISVTIATSDGEAPAGTSMINFVVTGFGNDDYTLFENPLVFTQGSQSFWFRANATARGKTGTLSITSDYVTIASDAAVTITIE